MIIAVVLGVRAWQQRDIVSGPAPALVGTLLDGRPFVLATTPPRPVLVHFWASWCPVCRAQEGNIAAIARSDGNVITVAMQSGTRAEVEHYLAEQGWRLPVVNDPDGRIAAAWGVHAVPASFIVDTNGQIRFVEIGYTTTPGLRLRLWLAELLS